MDGSGSVLQSMSASTSMGLAPGTYTLKASRVSTGLINGVTTGHDYDPRPLTQTLSTTAGASLSATPIVYSIAAELGAGVLANPGVQDIWSYIANPLNGTAYAWALSSGTIQSSSTNAYGLKWTAPSSTGTTTVECLSMDPYGVLQSFHQTVYIVPPLGAPPAMVYGPGVSGDTLANLVIGGSYQQKVDYLFKASGGQVVSLRKTLKWNSETRTGYSGGSGGSLHFEFFADDGSASHLPTGSRIGYGDLATPMADGDTCPQVSLGWKPTLTAGGYYHLVVTNSDTTPATNYLSTNELATLADLEPAQPTLNDIDWAVSYQRNGGSWTRRRGYLPSLELVYADGSTQGKGFIGAWPFAPGTISGTQQVREFFTVSGSSRSVQGVKVRVKRVSGASNLSIRLEDASGTEIETLMIPASSIVGAHHWVGGDFSSPHPLSLGSTYRLVLKTPSGTVYETFPLQDGTASAGFSGTGFSDGHADYNPGTGWVEGWQPYTATVQTDGDLQFYFY